MSGGRMAPPAGAGHALDSDRAEAVGGDTLAASGWQPALRAAALQLLTTGNASRKEAGFLGQMCATDAPTVRQLRWLNMILNREGLQALESRESTL